MSRVLGRGLHETPLVPQSRRLTIKPQTHTQELNSFLGGSPNLNKIVPNVYWTTEIGQQRSERALSRGSFATLQALEVNVYNWIYYHKRPPLAAGRDGNYQSR